MRSPTGHRHGPRLRGRPPRARDARLGSLRPAPAALAAALLFACELPPGIDTVDPGEVEPVPVGTAEINPPPVDGPWETDYLAWQPGGELGCGGAVPPVGGLPAERPEPFVVEIWEGVDDPCGTTPASGSRTIRLSLSDLVPGTFTVAPTCTGPLSAGASIRRFLGAQEEGRLALEGTVSITGISADDVVDGVFSVRFDGDLAFTSGGFRAPLGCVTSGTATAPGTGTTGGGTDTTSGAISG
jgi:hypothetical protein